MIKRMVLVSLVFSYLLGSVPFGLLMAKIAGVGDLRRYGSGNIGATNVARVAGKKLGLVTLLLDGGKGAFAVWIVEAHNSEAIAALAGFVAVAGHCFPAWLKFRGGKGVATALAVFLSFYWPLGLASCAVWLAAFFPFRISALAALAALASAPFLALLFAWTRPVFLPELNPAILLPLSLALAVLVIARHHANIRRLFKGEEKGFK